MILTSYIFWVLLKDEITLIRRNIKPPNTNLIYRSLQGGNLNSQSAFFILLVFIFTVLNIVMWIINYQAASSLFSFYLFHCLFDAPFALHSSSPIDLKLMIEWRRKFSRMLIILFLVLTVYQSKYRLAKVFNYSLRSEMGAAHVGNDYTTLNQYWRISIFPSILIPNLLKCFNWILFEKPYDLAIN